jgi:L-fuculose-phosphate aldolase
METLERVARIALAARAAGACEPLPEAAIEKVLAAAGKPPRGSR